MNRFVVEAPVAVKWFVPEPMYANAVRLFEGPNELLVTDVFFSEFADILRRKVGLGEITGEEALKIYSALSAVPLTVNPTEPLMEAAMEIAISMGRPIKVGLNLSLAIQQDCRLVTARRNLYDGLMATPFSRYLKWIEHA
ncbi:MAG: type II toxin-antitoxin system VapC family toxin, partial [bacterium]